METKIAPIPPNRSIASEQVAPDTEDVSYYSVGQVAAMLGVSRVTISRWIRDGRLSVARLGHRTVRVSRNELDSLLADGGLNSARTWIGRQRTANTSSEPGLVMETDGSEPSTAEHTVHFYETDAFLLEAVAEFLARAQAAGEHTIVVATPAHRADLDKRLLAHGVDLIEVRAAGRYVTLDAAETLAQFMEHGEPNPVRFVEVVGGVIAQAGPGRRVRVFGEMVALLAGEGDHAAALLLEDLWNTLQTTHAFSLFCAYPLRDFGDETGAAALSAVCATHTRVAAAEIYPAPDGPADHPFDQSDQMLAIVALQQKAHWLEAEIAARQRIEAELREEHRLIETLYRISTVVTAELDLTTVVQTVTDAATEVLGASVGAFFYNVVDAHGETYQLYTLSGASREAFAGLPMPRNTLVFGPTFRGEGVVRLDDVTRDPRFGHNAPYFGLPPGHPPVRSYLAVPVIARSSEVLGGLFFAHPQAGIFRERAERIARGIATQAANAIEKARLYALEQQARAAAQQALQVRDEFLGSISHDLRSPLMAITGFAQLLQRKASRGPAIDSERVSTMVGQMEAAAARMTTMVDELLDLTRLESGRPLDLSCTAGDAVALTRQVVGQFQRSSNAHQLEVLTDLSQLAVSWDCARMERVLANLLSNAIKYSPEGGTVSVRLMVEQQAGQRWLCLTVQDHGLGIPAADLPHIFERFHRACNVQGRIKGIGIGLAGAKQIVEQHGGTIAVTSTEGAGTLMTVRLPCDALAAVHP